MKLGLSSVLLALSPLVARVHGAGSKLSDASLRAIPSAGADFDIKTGALLAPILVPRVPGTPGSQAVRTHFADFFARELPDWKIEYHNSSATTPLSKGELVPFVNMIATRDPPWTEPGEVGRLTLVAHYDSLITTIDGHSEGFVGATDSAAPCAMLLQTARNVDRALTRKWAQMQAAGHSLGLEPEQGLQILLLDGEEAFLRWTDTDSVYGARALAEEWEHSMHAASSTYKNRLSNINLFVLLDLLGEKDPQVPSYFLTTHWAYRAMAALEARLRALGVFQSQAPSPARVFLPEADKTRFGPPGIGDDHVPFLQRGVEVLHLIPSPFPRHWHRITDDGTNLDPGTVEDWTKLVTAFAAEWMDLEGFLTGDEAQPAPQPAPAPAKKKSTKGRSDSEAKSELLRRT